MSRLANQYGAVNLGQGFPIFLARPSPGGRKAAIDADQSVRGVSRCTPTPCRDRQSGTIDTEWTSTRIARSRSPPATEAIFDAVQALVGPGDEIVVFEPFYDSYLPSAIMASASLRVVTLGRPTGHLTQMKQQPRSGRARCSCSTRRITRPAKSSLGANWRFGGALSAVGCRRGDRRGLRADRVRRRRASAACHLARHVGANADD